MVFNLDILAHGRSASRDPVGLASDEAAFRAVMKAWFTHSPLYEIFQARHGRTAAGGGDDRSRLVLGKRAALVYGNRDTSTNLRYKYGINLNTDSKQAIIVRKPMDYLLPDDGVNKNCLRARARGLFRSSDQVPRYERQYRGSFQHGGVSVEGNDPPAFAAAAARRAPARDRHGRGDGLGGSDGRFGEALAPRCAATSVLQGDWARARRASSRDSRAG